MTTCYCGVAEARTVTLPDASEHDLCIECESKWLFIWSVFAARNPHQANRVRKAGLEQRRLVADGGDA